MRISVEVLALQVGVDGVARASALGDGLDHGRCAGAHVAGAEDARPAGPKVTASASSRQRFVFSMPSAPLSEPVQLGALADGQQHAVAVDDELGALRPARGRRRPGRVGLAQRHALELDAGDLVVLVGDDARGRGLEDGARALLEHLVDLVGGGHVLHVAAVDERDLACSPGAPTCASSPSR